MVPPRNVAKSCSYMRTKDFCPPFESGKDDMGRVMGGMWRVLRTSRAAFPKVDPTRCEVDPAKGKLGHNVLKKTLLTSV